VAHMTPTTSPYMTDVLTTRTHHTYPIDELNCVYQCRDCAVCDCSPDIFNPRMEHGQLPALGWTMQDTHVQIMNPLGGTLLCNRIAVTQFCC